MTARIVPDDDAGRAVAIRALRAGGIVAIPTDTVYGICAALDRHGGIERLFQLKRRPPDKGIAVLLGSTAQAGTLGRLDAAADALANAFWPGGLTLVVPLRPDVSLPDALTGGAATIGLRVADHPAPRTLAESVGPLPTTSANVSAQPEARDAAEILTLLGEGVDVILDGGPAEGGPASTVVDCSGPAPLIRRVGAIPVASLAEALDRAGVDHSLGN